MKRNHVMIILTAVILLGIFAFTALADQPVTPTDLPAKTEQEATAVTKPELPAETETTEAVPEQAAPEQETPEADAPEQLTETTQEKLAETMQEQPAEAGAEGTAAAEPEQPAETTQETPAEDAAEPEATEPADPDREMLEAGYIQVMVIRENGTGLYDRMDEAAAAVGSLQHKDVVWVRPAEGIWAEVYRIPEGETPIYLNLNNVMLLQGQVDQDIPIRSVKLTSTLDGLTEIEEGTEITMTAEISGFLQDEITDVTWQYRTEGDAEDAYRDIADAHGLRYTYPVDAENIHNEWRVILTLKP